MYTKNKYNYRIETAIKSVKNKAPSCSHLHWSGRKTFHSRREKKEDRATRLSSDTTINNSQTEEILSIAIIES